MDFECRGTAAGTLDFGPYNRGKFMQFLKEHPGIRLKITAELPESGRLRRYYEGAVVPLIIFYQEGLDHRDGEHRRKVREWLKQEFNGALDPEKYKYWRDTVFPNGGPATYIDYLVETGLLRRV
jgi:hypothetical protein